MKSDILNSELNLIKDNSIMEWTLFTLNNAPEYFWTAQSSSTGKYHPFCTIKVGGLITHVKRAVYIANRLGSGWGIIGIDRDIVLSALILHDIAKIPNPKVSSASTYADYENHPINAEKYFAPIPTRLMGKTTIYDPTFEKIKKCINYHMGLWTPEKIKKPIKDYTLLELIVYTADYMATTKDLVTPKDKE